MAEDDDITHLCITIPNLTLLLLLPVSVSVCDMCCGGGHTEVIVNGNVAAYSKIEVDTRRSDGCVSELFGYNWMVFQTEAEAKGATPLITYYAFVFNATDVAQQCP